MQQRLLHTKRGARKPMKTGQLGSNKGGQSVEQSITEPKKKRKKKAKMG